MPQYQVPQFIETEAKIVGPLTLKQFIYVGVAGLLIFMLFFVLRVFFWFIVSAIIAVVALAFSFGKYNGQTLPVVLKNAFLYMWQPKLYLWKKEEAPLTTLNLPNIPTAKITPGSKLKGLWLKLTTKRPSGPPRK